MICPLMQECFLWPLLKCSALLALQLNKGLRLFNFNSYKVPPRSEYCIYKRFSFSPWTWWFPTVFSHAITTAYLALAFLITRFRLLVTVSSKSTTNESVLISVNITIRNMFISCNQVAINFEISRNLWRLISSGGILTFVDFKLCRVS